MKAIIDKYGTLYHQVGNRKWRVECPESQTEEGGPTCGDWCALWREITRQARSMYRGKEYGPKYVRIDCRGHEHVYDEYEDQRKEQKDEL